MRPMKIWLSALGGLALSRAVRFYPARRPVLSPVASCIWHINESGQRGFVPVTCSQFSGNYVFVFLAFPISSAEGAAIFGFVWVRGTKELCKFRQIREGKSQVAFCYHCKRRFGSSHTLGRWKKVFREAILAILAPIMLCNLAKSLESVKGLSCWSVQIPGMQREI